MFLVKMGNKGTSLIKACLGKFEIVNNLELVQFSAMGNNAVVCIRKL